MTDTTNSLDDVLEEVVDDQDTDQVSDQADDDSTDGEAEGDEDEGSQDDDSEEVEWEGGKYRIPKALKPGLLRQEDYTRKTQALAEERRQLEAERVKAKEDDEAIEEAKFAYRGVQKRLSDLQALSPADWDTIRQMDQRDGTNRYDQLQREFLTLPRQADESKRKLDEASSAAVQAKQEALAKRAEQGLAELQRDIPGWGPELGAKLTEFVGQKYGITAEKHGEAFMDPAFVKLANAAYELEAIKRKQAATKQGQAATATKPVPKPNGGGAKPAQADSMSDAEWFKREELAQVAERKRVRALRGR